MPPANTVTTNDLAHSSSIARTHPGSSGDAKGRHQIGAVIRLLGAPPAPENHGALMDLHDLRRAGMPHEASRVVALAPESSPLWLVTNEPEVNELVSYLDA